MRRLLAVIVVGAVVSHGAREARAQAVMGSPYSGSYRVSDYFACARALWHELRLRQLRRSSNVHHFLGLSRALLRLKRSGLRLSSRPLWRRPLASRLHGAWLRLRMPTSGNSYRTFPVVYGTILTVDQIAPPPSIGVYAPALGPSIGLYGR